MPKTLAIDKCTLFFERTGTASKRKFLGTSLKLENDVASTRMELSTQSDRSSGSAYLRPMKEDTMDKTGIGTSSTNSS